MTGPAVMLKLVLMPVTPTPVAVRRTFTPGCVIVIAPVHAPAVNAPVVVGVSETAPAFPAALSAALPMNVLICTLPMSRAESVAVKGTPTVCVAARVFLINLFAQV